MNKKSLTRVLTKSTVLTSAGSLLSLCAFAFTSSAHATAITCTVLHPSLNINKEPNDLDVIEEYISKKYTYTGKTPFVLEIDGTKFSVESTYDTTYQMPYATSHYLVANIANKNNSKSEATVPISRVGQDFSLMLKAAVKTVDRNLKLDIFDILSCSVDAISNEPTKDSFVEASDAIWGDSVPQRRGDGSIHFVLYHAGGCGDNRFRLRKGYSDQSQIYLHLIYETTNSCLMEVKSTAEFSRSEIIKTLGSDSIGKKLILVSPSLQIFRMGVL